MMNGTRMYDTLAMFQAYREEVEARCLKVLKDACERDWKDETPIQIASIAANAIYWRGKRAEAAEQERDRLQEALADTDKLLFDLTASLSGAVSRCIADYRYGDCATKRFCLQRIADFREMTDRLIVYLDAALSQEPKALQDRR